MKKFLGLFFMVLFFRAFVFGQTAEIKKINMFIDSVFVSPTKEEIKAAKKLIPTKYSCEGFKETGKIIFEDENEKAVGIEYKSDGLTIYGIIAYPLKTGKYPLIMYNHGGFSGLGSIDKSAIFYLVDEGYVVLASAYRGEKGPDGISDGKIEFAKGEVNDILNLVECGKKIPQVDTKKICFLGGSHGGINSLLAAERNKDVKCVLEYAGPTDMFADNFKEIVRQILVATITKKGQPPFIDKEVIPFVIESYENLTKDKDAIEKLKLELIMRSPLYFADDLKAGLFIVHGEADTLVPISHSQKLVQELDKLKKKYIFKTYAGQGHYVWGSAMDEMGELAPKFLNEYLK